MEQVGVKLQRDTMAGWNVPSDLPEHKSSATFRQKILEHDIYEVIKNGLNIEPYVIRRRLRRYESANNIRMAVNGLLKKRRITMVYQNRKNKRGSTKSNVSKNKYYRETIMRKAVPDKDTKPTALVQTAPVANPTAVVVESDVPAKAETEIADAELAGVAATAQDAGQDNDLGTRNIQHMSDIEYDIYHAINEGLSTEPGLIRKRLGKKQYIPDSAIREAINSLCKKKLIKIAHQTKLNKKDSPSGRGTKKTYYRKQIMRKVMLEEDPDPQIGRAKVTPTGKVNYTTMTKMVVYTDNEIEDMGPKRLMGLLRSDRTSKIQKDKIREILKKRIMLKAELKPDPDPQPRRAVITPTDKVDDTTMTKMVVYTDNNLEEMGPKRLMGLLKSDRTTKSQKDKIMEILKKKNIDFGHEPATFK